MVGIVVDTVVEDRDSRLGFSSPVSISGALIFGKSKEERRLCIFSSTVYNSEKELVILYISSSLKPIVLPSSTLKTPLSSEIASDNDSIDFESIYTLILPAFSRLTASSNFAYKLGISDSSFYIFFKTSMISALKPSIFKSDNDFPLASIDVVIALKISANETL